ncbi:MAG: hypothetical protein DHS20C15_14310 [Planctomycetota bacterium]|nr:MAG: hypothetical protein DHS20C15_14310 [Planctomycetota bacterium]
MTALLLKLWSQVRSSFWFYPSLMALLAVVLAFATIALDERVTDKWLSSQDWVYTGGAAGATAVLQTIAGSMITIAGVVFSLTLVALSLASSQFGPRLLSNFMSDVSTQVVLGTFVATFLYCLLILRTLRHDTDELFVPHLSITLGVVFALCSLWVLIYFIHHVSVSIQADEIIARVSRELDQGTERLFPERVGEAEQRRADHRDVQQPDFDADARPVEIVGDGYLQIVNAHALLELAVERDLTLKVLHRPGHYLVDGTTLLEVHPGERLDDELSKRLRGLFALGSKRTPAQDFEFSINQLVEIAVRALSPGVNDPFTAITCVDRIGSLLVKLATRDMPSSERFDEQGRLRVLAPAITYPALVEASLNQIRQHARNDVAVTLRLLETLAVAAGHVTREPDRAALRRQADMLHRGADASFSEEQDRLAAQERYEAVTRVLDVS